MTNALRTFVLVHDNKVISPMLVTVREYANWLENTFDSSISQMELYLYSKKGTEAVKEWHPGTKIGRFFDMQHFGKPELNNWYLTSESKGVAQLVKHNFAIIKDCRKVAGANRLRLYTVAQIDVYVKTSIDRTFDIGCHLLDPIKIVLSEEDMSTILKPAKRETKKKLF